MIKILKLGEEGVISERLNPDSRKRFEQSHHAYCQVQKGECVLMFYYSDISRSVCTHEKLCIYCGGGELVAATDSQKCRELLNSLENDKNCFVQLSDFLLLLTGEDIFALEELENAITQLEDMLISSGYVEKNGTKQIMGLRHRLLNMKRYYAQLSLIGSELAEIREAGIPQEAQKRFVLFNKRTDRLMDYVTQMREYITQVREAYQAQVDIEQNQIMKTFTVITAVFLPLTLLVGWYGMNLQMPEYSWKYGYPFAIVLSIAICAVCMLYFKRKKWF